MSKSKRNKIQQTLKDAYPSCLQWNGININIGPHGHRRLCRVNFDSTQAPVIGLTRLYYSINECVRDSLEAQSLEVSKIKNK